MKASSLLIPTLKEAPSEAQIDSHILMLRAGLIKKLVAGVYTYLPMGFKVLTKIESIIRQEMDLSSQEILCSAIQPKELWEESNRWKKYGPELIRFKDRHEREFCLGPTHEEVFTDFVRTTVKSYKSLPLNLYQIQSKYRDEIRPRFGLIRGREFIMKDAYSFDLDEKGLDISYQNMYKTYENIFTRLDINYKVVLADTGAIGGDNSHQFMALSEIGESQILYCDNCSYAADEEKATSILSDEGNKEELLELKEVETKGLKTCEDLAKFFACELKQIAKTMVYYDEEKKVYAAFVLRGDCEVNEIKVVNALNSSEAFIRLASEEELNKLGIIEGFIGPKGLNIPVFIDNEVTKMTNVIIGANKKDYHLINANYGRDFLGTVCDLKKAKANDLCPICGKPLKTERGIEVGQIFKLGTKYSHAMNCNYVDKDGKTKDMVMGCYGIGVSRTFASIIEQHHDQYGICFPLQVAPYQVVIVPVSYSDESQKALADKIYKILLQNKVEVVLDDRDLKPGFKFKDWDLIGIPYQIIVGKKASDDIVEFKTRSKNIKEEVLSTSALEKIIEIVKKIK